MKKLILLSFIIITGCGLECITKGSGVSSSSVLIDVPAKIKSTDPSEPSSYWIDSHESISNNQVLKMSVSGSVNLCPKDTANPVTKIVPNVFCNNGTPDYTVSSKDPNEICRNYGGVSKNGHYIDFGIKVNPEDVLRFSLVPRKIKIDSCDLDDLRKQGVLFDPDGTYFEDDKCRNGVPSSRVCESGGQFYVNFKDAKGNSQCIKTTELTRLKGEDYEVLVDHTFSPYGNKASIRPYNSSNWIENEISLDLRNVRPGIEELEKRCQDDQISMQRIKSRMKEIKHRQFMDIMNKMSEKHSFKGEISTIDFITKTQNFKEDLDNLVTDGFVQQEDIKEAFLVIDESYKLDSDHGIIVNITYDDAVNDVLKKLIDIYNNKAKPDSSTKNEDLEYIKNNFTSYDINCNCNTVCNTTINDVCTSTVAYKTCEKQIKICDRDEETGAKKDPRCEDVNKCIGASDRCSTNPEKWELSANGEVESWAGSLVAKIGGSSTDHGDTGKQCIPYNRGGGNCIGFTANIQNSSIKLNHYYAIDSNVPNNSSVMLGVSDDQGIYDDNFGGYHVKVEKSCTFSEGKKLYMYVGDSSPTIKPGEGGVQVIADENGMYEINGNEGVGKIYFGVDIENVDENQFKDIDPEVESQNKYTVTLFRTKWNPLVSNFFKKVKGKILEVLYGVDSEASYNSISDAIDSAKNQPKGAIHQIYNNHATEKFWSAVRALFALYIAFSSLGYMLGINKLTNIDLVIRVLKMSFIVALFSKNSWQFFSDHFFALFIHGVDEIIGAFNGYLKGDSSFQFLDATLGVLFAQDTWIRFLSLLLAGPVGWLIFYFIVWASIVFFKCMLEAILLYLLVIVCTAFLLALAPLFMTFILFQVTKDLFIGWLKLLVRFALEPIILFAALAFLNQVILAALYDITNYEACPKCVIAIKVKESQICLIEGLFPGGFTNGLNLQDRIREEQQSNSGMFLGLPFKIATVLLFVIVANAMKGFVKFSESMAQSISGTVSGLRFALGSASQGLLSVVGLDKETQNLIKQIKKRGNKGQSTVEFKSKEEKRPEHTGDKLDKDSNDKGDNNDDKNNGDDGEKIRSAPVSKIDDIDGEEKIRSSVIETPTEETVQTGTLNNGNEKLSVESKLEEVMDFKPDLPEEVLDTTPVELEQNRYEPEVLHEPLEVPKEEPDLVIEHNQEPEEHREESIKEEEGLSESYLQQETKDRIENIWGVSLKSIQDHDTGEAIGDVTESARRHLGEIDSSKEGYDPLWDKDKESKQEVDEKELSESYFHKETQDRIQDKFGVRLKSVKRGDVVDEGYGSDVEDSREDETIKSSKNNDLPSKNRSGIQNRSDEKDVGIDDD